MLVLGPAVRLSSEMFFMHPQPTLDPGGLRRPLVLHYRVQSKIGELLQGLIHTGADCGQWPKEASPIQAAVLAPQGPIGPNPGPPTSPKRPVTSPFSWSVGPGSGFGLQPPAQLGNRAPFFPSRRSLGWAWGLGRWLGWGGGPEKARPEKAKMCSMTPPLGAPSRHFKVCEAGWLTRLGWLIWARLGRTRLAGLAGLTELAGCAGGAG